MRATFPCLLFGLAACSGTASTPGDTSSGGASSSGGTSSGATSSGATSSGATSSGASSGSSGTSSDAGPVDAGADACGGPCVTYRAVNLATGLPRYAILRRDKLTGTCIRMRIEMIGDQDGLGITMTPGGWSVGAAERTTDVTDCDSPTAPAKGTSTNALSGSGVVSFVMGAPCTTSASATLKYPSGDEPFSALNLTIEGGCP